MPVTWDDAADKQMLLCMIHTNLPSIPNYDEIAKMMGEGYTVESIKQRFKKVKNKAKEQYGEPTVAKGEGGLPKTPAKRGAKKSVGESAAKSTGKRKTKKVASEDEGDDAQTGSPTKRVKMESSTAGEEDEEI